MALGPRQVAPELLSKVTKALGITALDQWYHVSHQAVSKVIGERALAKLGGTSGFLKLAYPHHKFDEAKLSAGINHEKDQKFMEVVIRKLFPNTEIHIKARKVVGIKNPETDAYLEIDIWIPSLKLGIEYQDKHHYAYQWYAHKSLEDYQKRDNFKKDAMEKKGYTLITIGYWWDKTLESVVSTIRKFRPDLLREYDGISVESIASEPPPEVIAEAPTIPGVAGIMNPFVPSYDFNPTNWYAGEKYDGVRGVFNPNSAKLFSRSGNELSVLPALLKDVPNMIVEGEIMAGRGNYNRTNSVSYHSHYDKVNWPLFRYILFDIPNSALGNYTKRYSIITTALSTGQFLFAQSPFRALLVDKPHLKMLLDAIISDAGEGVIVQKDASYEFGRAKGLAKIKVRRDADAKVLQVHKHYCFCKLVNGGTIDIAYSDGFDPSKLKIGDVVSYYHNGFSQYGKPIKAEIYKVRYDMSWEHLINGAEANIGKRRTVKEAVGGVSLITPSIVRQKLGHWNKIQNVRAFFDEYARAAGFDPLVPDNWYSVTTTTLHNDRGSGLLKAYGYSLKNALSSAYPGVKFDAKKFTNKTQTRANVRAFFDEFARTNGFDPLVLENWYTIRRSALINAGGDQLDAYNYDLKQALVYAYPELNFDVGKFIAQATTRRRGKMKNGHWSKSSNVRAFFDDYARVAGFDPLVPANWYEVTGLSLRRAGAHGILRIYGFFSKALAFAYPELRFEDEKFNSHENMKARKEYWTKSQNIRAFFDGFAKAAGFDSLLPENWYQVRHSAVRNAGGGGPLDAHDYSLQRALLCAYPELKFEVENFRTHNVNRKNVL